MKWKLTGDQNKENWNAGNGGDLVKHTVLVQREMERWRSPLACIPPSSAAI